VVLFVIVCENCLRRVDVTEGEVLMRCNDGIHIVIHNKHTIKHTLTIDNIQLT
jgi:hypothetical protein